jgi:hypothetical protein
MPLLFAALDLGTRNFLFFFFFFAPFFETLNGTHEPLESRNDSCICIVLLAIGLLVVNAKPGVGTEGCTCQRKMGIILVSFPDCFVLALRADTNQANTGWARD